MAGWRKHPNETACADLGGVVDRLIDEETEA